MSEPLDGDVDLRALDVDRQQERAERDDTARKRMAQVANLQATLETAQRNARPVTKDDGTS